MAVEIFFPISIPAGGSLSNAVNLDGKEIIRIIMPQQWYPAKLTMQISPDGGIYRDAFDQNRELGFEPIPTTVVFIRPNSLRALFYVRVRSGTRENPVPQSAQRDFQLVTLP